MLVVAWQKKIAYKPGGPRLVQRWGDFIGILNPYAFDFYFFSP